MNSLLPYLPQVAAILLAASRMIPRLESLWGWLPAKLRWLPPVLVVALPQIADALGVVESPLDLAEAVVLAVALLVPGARSSTHAKLAKGVSVLALFLLPVLTACSPATRDAAIADAHSAVADAKAAVAEAEGKAVEAAKAAQAAKAKAIKTARDTIAMVTAARQLAISLGALTPELEQQTGIALGYAEAVLGRVERGEQVARDELLSAVDAVAGVVSELRKLGRAVEPLVDSSLALVRAAVEAS
jgi:hypothetical protein